MCIVSTMYQSNSEREIKFVSKLCCSEMIILIILDHFFALIRALTVHKVNKSFGAMTIVMLVDLVLSFCEAMCVHLLVRNTAIQ